jgi:putative ABC transport system permease protein
MFVAKALVRRSGLLRSQRRSRGFKSHHLDQLFVAGVVHWMRNSTTAYLHHVQAPLMVTQQGVSNFLLSESTLPPPALSAVGNVSGVASVVPIVTISGVLGNRATKVPVLVIGHPAGQAGPWQIHSGTDAVTAGEVVVDRGLATTLGLHVGSAVTLLGRPLRVTGLSDGTNAAGIFLCFVTSATAQAITGSDVASYGLVHLDAQASVAAVGAAIDGIPGIHAVTPVALASSDGRMVNASFLQPTEIFLIVCYVIGLIITSIVLYTSTVEHARDFAVIKALGARTRFVYISALFEAAILTICGFVVGWLLANGLSMAFNHFRPVILAQMPAILVLETFVILGLVNLLATIPPVVHLRRVDPQEVFKA